MVEMSLREQVEQVIRSRIAPDLNLDGAAIEVLEVADGVARVRLHGACSSCPATLWTILHGIETELRVHIPAIEYLEASP